MSVAVLLHGRLASAPERRTSRNGNSFAMASIRVAVGTEAQYWRLFAFSETVCAELLRLGEGDSLAVQGMPKFELYQPANGGQPRVSLSVTVAYALPLRAPPRERKPKADRPLRRSIGDLLAPAPDAAPPPPDDCGGEREFNDEIPF